MPPLERAARFPPNLIPKDLPSRLPSSAQNRAVDVKAESKRGAKQCILFEYADFHDISRIGIGALPERVAENCSRTSARGTCMVTHTHGHSNHIQHIEDANMGIVRGHISNGQMASLVFLDNDCGFRRTARRALSKCVRVPLFRSAHSLSPCISPTAPHPARSISGILQNPMYHRACS